MSKYPGIERATLLIALDNGGINRDRSVEQQKRDLYKFLAEQPDGMLRVIDQWLVGLTEDQLETACCGEASETEAMLAGAPPFTDRLLNDYFDEVC